MFKNFFYKYVTFDLIVYELGLFYHRLGYIYKKRETMKEVTNTIFNNIKNL